VNYLTKIEIKNINMFIKLLDAIKPVIRSDEFHMVFHEDKFSIDAINSERTGMVSLNLGTSFFEGYDSDEKQIIPLPFDQFLDQVKMFKTFKLMSLDYDKNNNTINFHASEGRKRRKNNIQTISVLHPYVDPKTVKIPFNVMFSMDLKEFDKAMTECLYFDDRELDIKITDTEFLVSAEDNATNSGTEIAWKLGEDIDSLISEPMEIQFTTHLVTAITSKIKALTDKVTISMAPMAPMKLSLTFPHGSLVYHIVPNGLEDD